MDKDCRYHLTAWPYLSDHSDWLDLQGLLSSPELATIWIDSSLQPDKLTPKSGH